MILFFNILWMNENTVDLQLVTIFYCILQYVFGLYVTF